MLVKFRLLVVALPMLILSASIGQAGTVEQRVAVEEAMRRANAYFQENVPVGSARWDRSAYHTGNFRAWETLGVQSYYDRSAAWGEANSWLRGPEGISHADAHCCGQAYIDLYNADPQPVRTNSITSTLDYVLNSTDYVNDWSWIDAIYMAAPTLARLAVLNNDDRYFAAMYEMYMDIKVNRDLFNDSLGLWWRDGSYYETDTYWARGNGWVIAACARILEQLPSDDTTYRPEFESMLQTMAAALLPYQQSDGFWRSDIIDPTNFAMPETSGTAFFTYAIAYGLNEGILVDSPGTNYTAAVTNAWNGMVTIALHEDGLLGYAQNIGASPAPSTYDNDKDYTYGAFLLAGSELLRMHGGVPSVYPSAGSSVTLIDEDEDYAEPVMLNASNSTLRVGSIESYSWWSGSVFLGSGPELNLDAPLGTNTITLKIAHSDGNTYSSPVRVTVSRRGVTATASGNQDGNPPENTLDGRLSTRWSQAGDDGSEWIEYALPQACTLDHVDMAFYSGDARQTRFAIWLSADGSQSNLVRVLPPSGDAADYVSSSGTTLNLETFAFPAQPTKLVRIQGWGNSSSAWNSYTEVNIPMLAPTIKDQTDADANGFPDSWEIHYFGSTGQVAAAEIGTSGIKLREAYVLGLDPNAPDTAPMIKIRRGSLRPTLTLSTVGAFGVGYQGLTRKYRLLYAPSMTAESWTEVAGYDEFIGDNLPLEISITNTASAQFYKVQSWLENGNGVTH